jgi:hypothetical protein
MSAVTAFSCSDVAATFFSSVVPPPPVAASVQVGGYTRTTFVGAPQEAFVSAVSTSFDGAPVVVTSLARRRLLADSVHSQSRIVVK